MRIMFEDQGPHHHITVYDTHSLYGENGSFRVLQFADGAVQGALDLADPKRIMLEYPRAIIHLMEHNAPDFTHAFIIGHGIGTISRHFANRHVKTAELDPIVVEVSRSCFGYEGGPVLVGDGRELLVQERSGTLDYVVLDAFTSKGTPKHLLSASFFGLVCEKLAPEGSVLLNLAGRGPADRRIQAVCASLSAHFTHIRCFSLPSAGLLQNIVIIAAARPLLYEGRRMAGFQEFEPEGDGYRIED